MPGTPPLIEIRDAVVWRGTTRVFDGLTLGIAQGEHTAVLGPNGAGKTTLLKLISRELYPEARDRPSVRVLGQGLQNVAALRRRLGLVSPDLQHEYVEYATVRDVVLSGFAGSQGLAGVPFEPGTEHTVRAGRLIDELGLSGLERRRYGELSTGQQRRCLVARALVHRPLALILDEPMAGLDPTAAFSLAERIRGLMQTGTTVVLVTHDVSDIPPETGRVVLLKDGRIFADGPKQKILTGARLSELFDTAVRVFETEGYYVALPG